MKSIRQVGLMVLVSDFGPGHISFVGSFEKDEDKWSLFNGENKATIFSTRRETRRAIRQSIRYWSEQPYYPGRTAHYDIIELRRAK